MPTDEEQGRWMRACDRLVSDPDLCAQLAKARGWKPETIHGLAVEGSLGFENGNLCFLYDTGMKLRGRQKGQRIIYWAYGKPWIWRGSFLAIPSRRQVFICEGETDAIRLLDLGTEQRDPANLVVAAPSASTFNEAWTLLLEDKDVVLAFDDDEAGKKATHRVAHFLWGRVRSVKTLDWLGLRHAHA